MSIAPLIAALSLAVPYLSQTEALCGGAAAAMVFRYWGDSHADVQQFAPLVDKRAGGIADGTLVAAIEARGWQAVRFAGSIERLRDEIARAQPVVILVAAGGGSLHYVVVTGVDDEAVFLHDPTWGPSRRMAFQDLLAVWEPAGYWALLILPKADTARSRVPEPLSAAPEVAPAAATNRCDRLLNHAQEEAQGRPLGEAYDLLNAVHMQCPGSSAPLGEMAAARFAEGRWADAERLAVKATERDATNAYAWEVLASSRFVRDDFEGALRAWNRVGKPRIDLVGISGTDGVQFQRVATALGLWPNMLLTDRSFRRARRRLSQLPGYGDARLTFRPEADGFVTVEAALLPIVGVPDTAAELSMSAIAAGIDREVRLQVPGTSGQGEVWSGSWRWLEGSPGVAFGFAVPNTGRAGGVWGVEASWESTAYGGSLRETRAHGALSLGDWLTGHLRYSVTGGIDTWSSSSQPGHRRTLFSGGVLEGRWQDDRWSLAGTGTVWISPADGQVFQTTSIRAAFGSSTAADGWILRADAGVQHATDTAPMSVWPRAGEGRTDSTLLRAHPLFHDGAIDVTRGSVLGRTLVSAHGEAQRWMASAGLARVGAAAFVDVVRASRGTPDQLPTSALVDVGAGVRLRVPGAAGTLRVDFAQGLNDPARALTIGWQF